MSESAGTALLQRAFHRPAGPQAAIPSDGSRWGLICQATSILELFHLAAEAGEPPPSLHPTAVNLKSILS
jgi:hypothetical protein